MWARWIELALALWLVASPWIFGHAGRGGAGWLADLGAGAAVAGLALFAFERPGSRLRFLTLAVAAALVGAAFLAPPPAPPALQNRVVVGLLLAVFGIVPDRASRPSAAWRRFLDERSGWS